MFESQLIRQLTADRANGQIELVALDIGSSAEATAPIVVKFRDAFAREVRVGDVLRALIVLGPLVAFYFLSHEAVLLDLDLIAISLFITAQNFSCLIGWSRCNSSPSCAE